MKNKDNANKYFLNKHFNINFEVQQCTILKLAFLMASTIYILHT